MLASSCAQRKATPSTDKMSAAAAQQEKRSACAETAHASAQQRRRLPHVTRGVAPCRCQRHTRTQRAQHSASVCKLTPLASRRCYWRGDGAARRSAAVTAAAVQRLRSEPRSLRHPPATLPPPPRLLLADAPMRRCTCVTQAAARFAQAAPSLRRAAPLIGAATWPARTRANAGRSRECRKRTLETTGE